MKLESEIIAGKMSKAIADKIKNNRLFSSGSNKITITIPKIDLPDILFCSKDHKIDSPEISEKKRTRKYRSIDEDSEIG